MTATVIPIMMADGSRSKKWDSVNYRLLTRSPTLTIWAKLSIYDAINTLKQARGGFEKDEIYYYKDYPVKWVSLAGTIVAFDDWENKTVLTLDDSSGENIDLIVNKEHSPSKDYPPPDLFGFGLGDRIHARGTIVEGWGDKPRQMTLRRIEKVKDMHREIYFWSQISKWKALVRTPLNEEVDAISQIRKTFAEFLPKQKEEPPKKERARKSSSKDKLSKISKRTI